MLDYFFFQAEDGIRDYKVTGVQTCALPIFQGTAADILKMAMIALEKNLGAHRGGPRMLLTVHDEIVIETPEASAGEVAGIVKETMENVFPLAVPLAVDAHWGRSWFEAKE